MNTIFKVIVAKSPSLPLLYIVNINTIHSKYILCTLSRSCYLKPGTGAGVLVIYSCLEVLKCNSPGCPHTKNSQTTYSFHMNRSKVSDIQNLSTIKTEIFTNLVEPLLLSIVHFVVGAPG